MASNHLGDLAVCWSPFEDTRKCESRLVDGLKKIRTENHLLRSFFPFTFPSFSSQLGQGIDANLAGTGLDPVAEANMNSQPLEGEVDEQEFVRVHDASFWEAMPLSSQESVWNNFTNSYLEAINSLRPMVEQHDAQSATVNQPLPQDQLESNNLQLQDHQTNNHQLQHGAQSSLTPFQPPVRQVRRRHTQSSSTLDHALAPPRFH